MTTDPISVWGALPAGSGTAPPAIQTFANILALRENTASINTPVYVAGYYAPGDYGGGWFYPSNDDTTPDNGGSVIVDSQITQVRWKASDPAQRLEQWGVVFDAFLIANSTGAITAGQKLLTGSTTFPTASANISIEGAGAAFADTLSGQNLNASLITTVASGGGVSCNLAVAATTTVTTANVWSWTTDNTAAMLNALTYGPYELKAGNMIAAAYCAGVIPLQDVVSHRIIGSGKAAGTGFVFGGAPFPYKASMAADTLINTKNYGFLNGVSVSSGLVNILEDLTLDSLDATKVIPYANLWTPSATLTSFIDVRNCSLRGYVSRHLQYCNIGVFRNCTLLGVFACHAATMPVGAGLQAPIQKMFDDSNIFLQLPNLRTVVGSCWYDNDATGGTHLTGYTLVNCTMEAGYQMFNTNAERITTIGHHVDATIVAALPVVLNNNANLFMISSDFTGLSGPQQQQLAATTGVELDSGGARFGTTFYGVGPYVSSRGLTTYAGNPNGVLTEADGTICVRTVGAGVGSRIYVNAGGGTAWNAIPGV